MSRRVEVAWGRLLAAVSGIQTCGEFRSTLVEWLRENVGALSSETVRIWGLSSFASIDPEQYPEVACNIDPLEELGWMNRNHPQTFDSLGMNIRDLIWETITIEVSDPCPKCEGGVKILFDPNARSQGEALVLSCDQCAFAEYLDGRSWKGAPQLRPPTTAELKAGPLGWKKLLSDEDIERWRAGSEEPSRPDCC